MGLCDQIDPEQERAEAIAGKGSRGGVMTDTHANIHIPEGLKPKPPKYRNGDFLAVDGEDKLIIYTTGKGGCKDPQFYLVGTGLPVVGSGAGLIPVRVRISMFLGHRDPGKLWEWSEGGSKYPRTRNPQLDPGMTGVIKDDGSVFPVLIVKRPDGIMAHVDLTVGITTPMTGLKHTIWPCALDINVEPTPEE
jgi:hypothetical protein